MSTDAQPRTPAPPPQNWVWGIVAGLAFAGTALAASALAQLPIRPAALGGAGEVTIANIVVGVFACGWLVWWLVVLRTGQASAARGAAAGVLVACLSYPVVLLLAEFVHADPDVPAAGTQWAATFLHALEKAALGIVTTGFASTIALAVVGLLLALLQRKLAPYPAREGETEGRRGNVLGRLFRFVGYGALVIVGVLVAAFVILTVVPVPPLSGITADPPAEDYEQAIADFAAIEAREATMPLRPDCHSRMRTHDGRSERVVVYFHGLTSCPAQFDALGDRLFALGFNVLVPRLPGHGEANPLTLALAHVTAEDFIATANTALAMAHGLGDEVTIIGLSAGGTIATYETQEDGSVMRPVSVAPFLGPHFLPPWATHAAANLLLWIPNMMIWWNPRQHYSSPATPYVYPRYATRAIAQFMRLGRIVAEQASNEPPAARGIGMLLNENDHAINNNLAVDLASAWERHGAGVQLRFLPRAYGLPHDVIDAREPEGRIGVVYPILLEMIVAGE